MQELQTKVLKDGCFFLRPQKNFNSINLFLASNLETTNFLNKLNVRNIVYNGNIKLLSQVNKKDLENNNKDTIKKSFGLQQVHMRERKIFVYKHILI